MRRQLYYRHVGCDYCGVDCIVVVLVHPHNTAPTVIPYYVGSCFCGRMWTRDLFESSKEVA